jgi:hypothetical protein
VSIDYELRKVLSTITRTQGERILVEWLAGLTDQEFPEVIQKAEMLRRRELPIKKGSSLKIKLASDERIRECIDNFRRDGVLPLPKYWSKRILRVSRTYSQRKVGVFEEAARRGLFRPDDFASDPNIKKEDYEP